ncbi:MAG: 2-C-methyl-D-erythritol 4-phosphate cytidylyltransferase [Bacteroidales bacterium]
MQKYVIIVAGGRGNRFNSAVPKQFVKLLNLPVLMHTILAFYNYSPSIKIIIVLPEDQFKYWEKLCLKYNFSIPHRVVNGGVHRFHSVKNGLSLVGKNSLVAVHDGVRPLIDAKTIDECFKMAENEGNAIPVVEPVDSIRELMNDGSNKVVDRQKFRLIQTPQVFKSDLIQLAYKQEYNNSFTDDAGVFETCFPGTIKLVEGNRQNIKITTPEDLIYAKAILKNR